jgi:hypothetical protein
MGFGVTAWSVDDAIKIVRQLGYGMWLPTDLSLVQVTSDVEVQSLHSHVKQHMGPVVVRGLWYPFRSVGVPRETDR